MLILIIAGGPDKGRIYELLDGQEVVLGREGDQVKLNDRKVSREHARLWSEGGQWYIEDLGSRHGTHRNHEQLDKGATAKVKDGDYIQVGSTVMVMGRMPAEHAERLALVGQSAPPTPAWRRPGVLVGGGVAAALALLGTTGYLVYQMDLLNGRGGEDARQFAELQRQLIASQEENAEATRRLEAAMNDRAAVERDLLSRLDNVGTGLDEHQSAMADATSGLRGLTDPLMDRLAELERQSLAQQASLGRVSEMLAHQAQVDNSAEVYTLLEELQTQFADQPRGDELVEQLAAAIENNAEQTGQAVQRVLDQFAADEGQVASAARTEALVEQVLEELAAIPSTEEIAEGVRTALGDPLAGQDRFMREVLAELRRNNEQMRTTVASMLNEDAGQAQRLMAQVLDELGGQPNGEELAEQLRAAMDQAATGDADADAQLAELMQQVLAKLDAQPTSEQLAADLRAAVGEDAQRTQQLMAQVLEELGDRPTAGDIAEQIRAADAGSAQRTAEMMESILARIDEQNALAAEVAQLRGMIEDRPDADGTDELIRAAIARIDEQSRNSAQLLHAIAELRESMPADVSDQLDQVLTKLDEQVRGEQLVEAIEATVERLAAARDQDTLAAIEAMQERLNALPSAEQLAGMLDSQQELAALLDETDARAALGELRAALENLAQAQPESTDQRLDQILAMLEEREELNLMLAEMHDLMESQPEQAEAMRAELLAAIERAGGDNTDRLLEQILAEVQQRLATDDTIRLAIREEIAGTVQPNRMALEDGHDVATNPANTRPAGGDTGGETDNADTGRLTDLERAYREAFETGRPVTVGAGVIDASTGQVSEGRRLDPAVAKALGYTTWRDWYLTDQHAERMRLQQQAQRDRNNAQSEDPDDIVTLPGPEDDG